MENTAPLPQKPFLSLDDLKEVRCFHESPREVSWTSHKKHFFILTDSARPVYSRYGDEVNITPLLCTIVAFIGQLERDGKTLKKIKAGDKSFIFYLPLPFIFVCVSSIELPDSILIKELKILEMEIFSILTPNIVQILQRRPNFDIKRQTQNSEKFFTSALYSMDNYFTFVFNDCVPMAPISNNRETFEKIVRDKKVKSVLAAVVLFQGDVFIVGETHNFHLTNDDLFILSNNVWPPNSYENCWSPIWLPSNTKMFHILTYGVNEYSLQIILISENIEAQAECVLMAENIVREIKRQQLTLNPINNICDDNILSWVVANHKLKQVYSPFMQVSELSEMIYSYYAWTYDYLKNYNVNGNFYITTEELTLFGTNNNNKTLMAAAPFGITEIKANELLDKLKSYIKQNNETIFDLNQVKWE